MVKIIDLINQNLPYGFCGQPNFNKLKLLPTFIHNLLL